MTSPETLKRWAPTDFLLLGIVGLFLTGAVITFGYHMTRCPVAKMRYKHAKRVQDDVEMAHARYLGERYVCPWATEMAHSAELEKRIKLEPELFRV